MIRIYLAGRWENQAYLRIIRSDISKIGHAVTSRWLDEGSNKSPRIAAEDDLADIDRADLLVLYLDGQDLPPGFTSGGRWIEFGYALGKDIPVCVVGPTGRTVFLQLAQVHQFKNWSEFYSYLNRRYFVPKVDPIFLE